MSGYNEVLHIHLDSYDVMIYTISNLPNEMLLKIGFFL